jgi:hypothetical protein
MEIFINELSLHGQYPSQETFTKAVTKFVEVFSYIQDKVKSNEMLKDELFITSKALKDETFQQSFERIKNRQLKDAFRGIIFNKLKPKNWQSERLHSPDDLYTAEKCSHQETFVTETSVAEIAERKLQRPQKRFLLINFIESQFNDCGCFDVKKDGHKLIIELDCIETKEALKLWLDLPTKANLTGITAGGINNLIILKQTHIFFKRVDTPKILGEQLHIHLNDTNKSALNLDGSWKHGNCEIPIEAKEILVGWGFTMPT